MTNENITPSPSSSFRYSAVLAKGKPVHEKGDDFYIKHPPMDLSKRAKIFAPFDALKGYSEAIASVEAKNLARYENTCGSDNDDENLK